MKSQNKNFSVAIIGGGASGLMSAVITARLLSSPDKSVKVTVFEKNQRVGKKILVTGNGRCNLTNRDISADCYFGAKELFKTVYAAFDNASLTDFFDKIGLKTKSDFAGRVYPLSNQASSVLDALRYEALRLGVEFITETKVTSVSPQKSGFLINGSFFADKCIFACGGKAAPVHGSDGSGFDIMRSLGICLTDIFPALAPIEIKNFTKSLKGIRAEGKICSSYKGQTLLSAQGELQYTDYGISGIPAMQISRSVSELINSKGIKNVDVFVDSTPDISDGELTDYLKKLIKSNPELPCEMLLAGIMPKRLGTFLMTECGIDISAQVSYLSSNLVDKLVFAVKHKQYSACAVKSFKDAQVTAGGVKADEIVATTLELKKLPGAYICGELADVDGTCGGYNLQWAFSSGYLAGKSAAEAIINAQNK